MARSKPRVQKSRRWQKPGRLAILRAILSGERDPQVLARLRDRRCRRSEAQIAVQLTGQWRADHLFNLRHALGLYAHLTERIADYNREILVYLDHLQTSADPSAICDWLPPLATVPVGKSAPASPSTPPPRVSSALRMSALAVGRSSTALGAYYRRIARRKGASVAIFAAAHKLAQLIYPLLRFGQHYVDIGAQAYEDRFTQRRLHNYTQALKSLGYQVVPIQEAPSAP